MKRSILIALLMIIASLGVYSFAANARLDTAISWLYSNGLTTKNTATTFKADQGLRRDEAAKFFVGFAKIRGKTGYVKTDKECTFSDMKNSWADLKPIVTEACKLGLFQGSKGKFNPQKQVTNAQAIAVLVRLLAGNQNENGTHRADNYYTQANKLSLLKDVSMNSKNATATRGNVAIIIWEGNNYSNPYGYSARNRYNSSLGFSIILPGKCSDGHLKGSSEPHWIENLNYGTNGYKDIECIMPDNVLELSIHDSACENEQSGQQVIISGYTFIMSPGYYSPPELGGAGESRCYKTTYIKPEIRFDFIRGYDNNIIQEILGSLNVSI